MHDHDDVNWRVFAENDQLMDHAVHLNDGLSGCGDFHKEIQIINKTDLNSMRFHHVLDVMHERFDAETIVIQREVELGSPEAFHLAFVHDSANFF
jgi:hypothetical protein